MTACSFEVSTFYKFVDLGAQDLSKLKAEIFRRGEELEVHGLLLLAAEGCNATVAAQARQLKTFREFLASYPFFADLEYKNSSSNFQPFRRLKIDVRPEIVTFDGAAVQPGPGPGKKLTPSEWHKTLETESDFVLIDTRNIYETEIGAFRGAIDPRLQRFSQFSDYVRASGIPKSKKVLMYCTGGIRCEKASLEMERLGYDNVYQLSGGILKYLEEFPAGRFDGECFVFDHRVAVDNNLQPSTQYKLCPHCGNPAKESVSCRKCGKAAIVCRHCLSNEARQSCSKNCAHHLERKAA
jgi:UPF0176 protein